MGASAARTTITGTTAAGITTAGITTAGITTAGITTAGQDESQLSLLDPLGERGHRWNWVLAAEPTHPDDHGV
ncbi:MAG: hypothetical protein ACRDQV_15745, partial [Pseudonocardiaceae bacterium]